MNINAEKTRPQTRYGTQVLSGGRKLNPGDPVFAGYRPEILKVGETYKYIVGVSDNQDEAVSEFLKIRKKFPTSFMVKYSETDSPVPYKPAIGK